MTPAVDKLAVQEMVRATMYRLAAKRPRPQSTKMEILKILYDTKSRLSDANPYKNALPYYWYRDGPFCEPVYAGLQDLIRSGLAKEASKPGAYVTYSLASGREARPLVTSDPHMDDVREAISDVVDAFININDMRRHMYERAPYNIYTSYRLEFEPQFESLCRATVRGVSGPCPDDVAELLDKAAADYPQDAAFDGQWQPFGDFVVMAMSFLVKGPREFEKSVAEKMLGACERAWYALTAGIRIERHDPYYVGCVPKWNVSRSEKISELRSAVVQCSQTVMERAGRSTVIDAVGRLGMESSADRLRELEQIADDDPDEDRMNLESMSQLAAFIVGRRLPEPDIGACPDGEAQAVWWPPNGILSMDFGPGNTVTYASVLRSTGWRKHGQTTPDRVLTHVVPAVAALRM